MCRHILSAPQKASLFPLGRLVMVGRTVLFYMFIASFDHVKCDICLLNGNHTGCNARAPWGANRTCWAGSAWQINNLDSMRTDYLPGVGNMKIVFFQCIFFLFLYSRKNHGRLLKLWSTCQSSAPSRSATPGCSWLDTQVRDVSLALFCPAAKRISQSTEV